MALVPPRSCARGLGRRRGDARARARRASCISLHEFYTHGPRRCDRSRCTGYAGGGGDRGRGPHVGGLGVGPWPSCWRTVVADVPLGGGGLGAGIRARHRRRDDLSGSSGSATAWRSWCSCGTSPARTTSGFNLLLAVLLGTWASDIFAYFGGRLIGRHRLAPAISPNKTVEGLLIGLVLRGRSPAGTLYDQRLSTTPSSAFCAWAGRSRSRSPAVGDLFESFSSATWG